MKKKVIIISSVVLAIIILVIVLLLSNKMTYTIKVSMVDDYSEDRFEKVCQKEDILDKYEDHLGTYLMRVSKTQMNLKQSKQVSKFLHTISDFERLGDHAMNIAFICKDMQEKGIEFSEDAYEAVAWCSMKEVVIGRPDGTFGAKDGCTRAELATIMVRLVELFKD